MVERLNGIEEVTGSNPVGSTPFYRGEANEPEIFHDRVLTQLRIATKLFCSLTRFVEARGRIKGFVNFTRITSHFPLHQFPMIALSPSDLENSSPAGQCTLSSGVKIKGSITFQQELVIDGKVQGKISSDGVLTIGENADIRGKIKTKSVTVYSKVHGNITAERCELKSMCTLEGDLRAARLIIEEGATFIGSSQNTLATTVKT